MFYFHVGSIYFFDGNFKHDGNIFFRASGFFLSTHIITSLLFKLQTFFVETIVMQNWGAKVTNPLVIWTCVVRCFRAPVYTVVKKRSQAWLNGPQLQLISCLDIILTNTLVISECPRGHRYFIGNVRII